MSAIETRQLIRVGHSPDPDDAFMFHALTNDCVDTGRYMFTHELVDIETLNQRAFRSELELTAISIHAYAFLTRSLCDLQLRGQHGRRLRPDGRRREACSLDELKGKMIAMPGKLTSAYLALRLCLGAEFRACRCAVRRNHPRRLPRRVSRPSRSTWDSLSTKVNSPTPTAISI